MYVYLIETKAVHSSAFPALFYLTLVLSTSQPLGYNDQACSDSKHMFAFTSLLAPMQDGKKLGRRVGTRQRIRLGVKYVSWPNIAGPNENHIQNIPYPQATQSHTHSKFSKVLPWPTNGKESGSQPSCQCSTTGVQLATKQPTLLTILYNYVLVASLYFASWHVFHFQLQQHIQVFSIPCCSVLQLCPEEHWITIVEMLAVSLSSVSNTWWVWCGWTVGPGLSCWQTNQLWGQCLPVSLWEWERLV